MGVHQSVPYTQYEHHLDDHTYTAVDSKVDMVMCSPSWHTAVTWPVSDGPTDICLCCVIYLRLCRLPSGSTACETEKTHQGSCVLFQLLYYNCVLHKDIQQFY